MQELWALYIYIERDSCVT